MFDEIYGTYYIILEKILEAAFSGITLKEIEEIIYKYGYEETIIHMLPRLTSGEWQLLEERNGKYYSKLKNQSAKRPISALEKGWLRAVLKDKRMGIFLSESNKEELESNLRDTESLYNAY